MSTSKTAMRYQHPETGQVGDIMNQRNPKPKLRPQKMVAVLVTESV
jgi:hypothetical protein